MTPADKLRELLATRPAVPSLQEMTSWWRSGAALVAEVLMELRDREIMVEDRGRSFASLLEASGRIAAERDKLQAAAPVMLTVMALLADEADMAGLREVAAWHRKLDPEYLETWLDAEHARAAAEKAKAAAPDFVQPVPVCTDFAPAGYSGHWRDYHRGHGCELDPDVGKVG